MLNVRNNVDHFAREKEYSVRSKADRVILKRAQELAPQSTMSSAGTQPAATNTIDGHQQLRDLLDAQDAGGVIPHTQPSTSHQVRPHYDNVVCDASTNRDMFEQAAVNSPFNMSKRMKRVAEQMMKPTKKESLETRCDAIRSVIKVVLSLLRNADVQVCSSQHLFMVLIGILPMRATHCSCAVHLYCSTCQT